jgi:hypothetical protein
MLKAGDLCTFSFSIMAASSDTDDSAALAIPSIPADGFKVDLLTVSGKS